MSLSTHVLDATSGTPAAGLGVRVESQVRGAWHTVAHGVTNTDGRVNDLGALEVGVHRLTFDTAGYFGRLEITSFYPEVAVTFQVTDAAAHHHVPLLLSPFAYSTYRGS
jgi:5-hydroxyisourate hydrolase